MSFLHPIFLWGALAAAIPILVHLFDRRRPRRVPFGAISFVLRSQKRTASRLKLKRLLIYALRTFVFLALPIALARPQWDEPKTGAAKSGAGPKATSVVLDASMSMRFKPGSKSLFELGVSEAKSAVNELGADEPLNVVVCDPHPLPPGAPSFEKRRWMSALDDARASYGLSDLNRCLELAARSLEDSPLPGKRIVLVSDFTVPDLRLEAPAPIVTGPKGEPVKPEVVLRDVVPDTNAKVLPNRALVDMRAEPAPQLGPRAWQFTFTVRNGSDEPVKDLELQLKIEGKVVSKGFVDLGPGATAQKVLSYRFEEGGLVSVEGVLAPDALVEDDHRSMVLDVPKELKALVVNGSPSPQRYRDEAFFVEAALSSANSPVRPVTRDTEAAWKENFTQYDLVMLLNVAAPPPEVARSLSAFVQNGGGLFVSMGDRVDADAWNAAVGPLLPRRLRLVKTAVEPSVPDASARAAKLSQVSQTHPVLQPFIGQAKEGLYSARFYRYLLLEPGGGGDDEVLATLDDGAPALAAARRGKGRVLLFTSTVDRDWSDFAIRTSFLPFMQRAGSWLAGSLDEREELKVKVGETVNVPPNAVATSVKSPQGKELPVVKQGESRVIGPVTEPGVYWSVGANGQREAAASFAAVLEPSESDLTRLNPDALSGWFGEETVRAGAGSAQASRVPVWTWLILAAVLAFFFEGVLLKS
ncbi:MAG: BatA domain-containing protein [Myxococcaceae bacterium]